MHHEHDDIDSFDSYKVSDTADAHFFTQHLFVSVCCLGAEGDCIAQNMSIGHDIHITIMLLLVFL